MKRVTLYRPVGPKELELIEESGWKAFPPRLAEQPIFYPVVQEAYATRIARDWNVKESGAGFVTRFDVDGEYLSQFDVQFAGGQEHTEYWIPAERLEEFNRHIIGTIVNGHEKLTHLGHEELTHPGSAGLHSPRGRRHLLGRFGFALI